MSAGHAAKRGTDGGAPLETLVGRTRDTMLAPRAIDRHSRRRHSRRGQDLLHKDCSKTISPREAEPICLIVGAAQVTSIAPVGPEFRVRLLNLGLLTAESPRQLTRVENGHAPFAILPDGQKQRGCSVSAVTGPMILSLRPLHPPSLLAANSAAIFVGNRRRALQRPSPTKGT
jgi:hypothetical protein